MNQDPNDDKTVIAGGAAPPPAPAADHGSALPIGTRLGEFEIVELIGVGGFGIVYLALDHSLGRRVALKEYMPQSLATRGAGAMVSVRSARHAETFEAGRRSFVNEARLLAQFDHAALVKVYRFWEANGTAYMVMPFYEGHTLKDALRSMPAPPDEAWLKRLLAPLLDALEAIHAAQVFHRDIAPDNIMLLAGDRPLLLDFGAARHVISGMTQALTVILKPGYAPIEQYAEVPDLKQGAWTDLYALAAVVYFAIGGKTPIPAVGRMMNDSLVPLAKLAAGRYSESFLRTIDEALAVKPADRPQSVAELRARLGLPEHAASTLPGELAPQTTVQVDSYGAAPARSRTPLFAGVALALVVAIGVAAFMLLRDGEPATPTTVAEAPKPPDTGASAPPSAPRPQVEPPPPVVVKTYSPYDEIERIFEQRDRGHNVSVTMSRAQLTIGRDKLNFNVSSSKAGYLYVLVVSTDRQQFLLLFPNKLDADNRIAAGGRLELPRKTWQIEAAGPAGTNQYVALVSENRRDFSAAGLVPVDQFGEFPADIAARIAQAAGASAPAPFAGQVVCADGVADCSAAYGAAMFTIEEVEPVKR